MICVRRTGLDWLQHAKLKEDVERVASLYARLDASKARLPAVRDPEDGIPLSPRAVREDAYKRLASLYQQVLERPQDSAARLNLAVRQLNYSNTDEALYHVRQAEGSAKNKTEKAYILGLGEILPRPFSQQGSHPQAERRHAAVSQKINQYKFSLIARRLEDFAARCTYQQTSPRSHFTRKTVCSLATEQGRITLSNKRFIRTEGGGREEREVEDGEEYRAILAHEFGMETKGMDVGQLMGQG